MEIEIVENVLKYNKHQADKNRELFNPKILFRRYYEKAINNIAFNSCIML